jgi:hypothetical protein
MSWVATAVVGAAVVGGVVTAAVSNSAADEASDAATYASDLQYQTTQQNIQLAREQMAQASADSMRAAEMMAGATTEAARIQAEAAKYAADNSYRAAAEALALQETQWRKYQENIKPYMDAGGKGLNQLSYGLGLQGYTDQSTQGLESGYLSRPFTMADYQADPGYAFRLSEGIKALDRSASARGNLLSGSTLKGVTQYGQDMASQEYQNAYNRYTANQTMRYNQLASLAGMGQNTAVGAGNAGMQMANNAGQIMTNAATQANQYGMTAAQAQAAGLVNSAQYAGQQSQYANNLGAQYTGQIMSNNLAGANALGNAAMVKANANASSYQAYGNIASSLANALGNYYGSTYAQSSPYAYNPSAFSNYNPNQWAGSSGYLAM